MDATGNLTKNNAGGDTQATLAKLATATGAKAATIQTDKGTFTSDGTAFDGASMSIDANTFANAVKNDTYTATVGAKTYSVTTGSAAADTAYMSNGVLSDTPPTYYAQADGSITTTEDAAAGKLVYKGSDGKLTTDTTSKAESTSDPLAALDDAISQIDKFRSSLVRCKTVWIPQ